jgi:hypothetical protein
MLSELEIKKLEEFARGRPGAWHAVFYVALREQNYPVVDYLYGRTDLHTEECFGPYLEAFLSFRSQYEEVRAYCNGESVH